MGGEVGSRHEFTTQFCFSRVTKQTSTFLNYPKIEVVQNVKNIMLVPFCKTECFD